MPRQARLVLPGQLYHVTQRGNYKQNIFENVQDRAFYLRLIQEYSLKYGCDVFAFCLMNNHIHFIVKPKNEDSLANVFGRTNQRYGFYFNKKKDIKGHLWQERFYSCLLLGNHIQNAIRYVERNPVRAGMVTLPWDHVWSSARAHLGTVYNIIHLADIQEQVSVESWKDFLLEVEPPDVLTLIRKHTLKGKILGSDEQIRELELKTGLKLLSKLPGNQKPESACHLF
jgi:putative transposase